MSLDLYRRHGRTCKYYSRGQHYTGCTCPIWCYGYLEGRRIRKAVGLRDWSRAVKRVERWEEKPAEIVTGHSVSKCVTAYLDDCRARNLAGATITSYEKTLEHFTTHCNGAGLYDIHGVDLNLVTAFRQVRATIAVSSRVKELEHLRSFCSFCVQRKWMAENFAKFLKRPSGDLPPTMPFDKKEVKAILGACDLMTNFYEESVVRAKPRARALVYLLLYSGFRISDAVKLERSRVNFKTGQLLVRIMKTRRPLYVRLHRDAIKALKTLPTESPYFFWSGRGKLSSAVGSARRTIACLMKLADIKGHPHRFRDTFAVELLSHGEDIRTVQMLLGHSSLQTTERHYAPFVAAFQAQIDRATAKLKFG